MIKRTLCNRVEARWLKSHLNSFYQVPLHGGANLDSVLLDVTVTLAVCVC